MTPVLLVAALAVGLIAAGLSLVIGWAAMPIGLGLGILVGLVAGRD